MNYNDLAVAAFFLDSVRKRAAGQQAYCWDLNLRLPIAPTIEESLRIVMQDWDADEVEHYIVGIKKNGERNLELVRGKPVLLEGVSDFLFAVHTDEDHRFRWRVSEVSSGSAMSMPHASEQEAIEAAKKGLARFGRAGLQNAIDNARDGLVAAFARKTVMPSVIHPVGPEEAQVLKRVGVQSDVGDLMFRTDQD
jgi:hypothetical protein